VRCSSPENRGHVQLGHAIALQQRANRVLRRRAERGDRREDRNAEQRVGLRGGVRDTGATEARRAVAVVLNDVLDRASVDATALVHVLKDGVGRLRHLVVAEDAMPVTGSVAPIVIWWAVTPEPS